MRLRLHRSIGLLLLAFACVAAACSFEGGGAGQEFAVLPAHYIEAEDGTLIEGRDGLIVYARQSDTVCRHNVERETEVCISDERFAEARIEARLASEATLVIAVGDGLGFNSDGALTVDFDSRTVREVGVGAGRPASLSPSGNRLLWSDLRTASMSISGADGSSPTTIPTPQYVFGGRWAGDDLVWVHDGSGVGIYDDAAGTMGDFFVTDPAASPTFLYSYPELDLGLGWDLNSVREFDFGPGSLLVIDLAAKRLLPIEQPGVGFPLALGVAPDGSSVVSIWERDEPPIFELFIAPIDRDLGVIGETELIHTFDVLAPNEVPVLDMNVIPVPERIVVGDDGRLTWYTDSAVMTADLGR